VGQKRLQKAVHDFAVETASDQSISTGSSTDSTSTSNVLVEWKPYQIDPGTKLTGEPFEAYCKRRWGSSSWTDRLRATGTPEGATFGNWQWWPNTLKSHQWIQYGKEKHNLDTSQANALLFRALYEDGENLSETNTLVNLAAKEFTDWDLDDLCEYLDGNKGATAVDQEIQSGQQRFGIKGVPFFVVGSDDGSGSSNQKPYAFSGAQTSETFCDIFRELSERK
jgi:predicted DsbA family dithiol-disulfide isomerase